MLFPAMMQCSMVVGELPKLRRDAACRLSVRVHERIVAASASILMIAVVATESEPRFDENTHLLISASSALLRSKTGGPALLAALSKN